MDLIERLVTEISQRLKAGESQSDILHMAEEILTAEARKNLAQVSETEYGYFDVALRVEARVAGAETAEIAEGFVRRWFEMMPCSPEEADSVGTRETLEDLAEDDDGDISVTSVTVPEKRHIA